MPRRPLWTRGRSRHQLWHRLGRWLRRGFGAVWTLVLLAGFTFGALAWVSLPPDVDGAVSGLGSSVTVTMDDDGIPLIRAGSERDAAAALGFLHARDRMFQMDLTRRNASGRLSEIAGPATLRLDRTMRVLGLRRRAEADLAGLDRDTRAVLDAYAAGVNAWIAARGRFAAPEFIPLGAPEPWNPVDSLLWGKTMGLYLSGNWRLEVARAAMLQRQPGLRVQDYWPPQDGTPRVDASIGGDHGGNGSGGLGGLPTRLADLVPAFPEPFTLPDEASNEWAVDGQHTLSGAPMLAGDPHLAFSMPAIWYLARIETPGGVLAGATAPGVPFLVMGHNGRIAWTFTTTGAATQDVFVETALPDGTYATPEGPRAFMEREERIRVRGQPDEVLRVRETRHGPVLSDLDAPDGPALDRPVLAVSMANLAPGDLAATGLLALDRAGDVAAAGRAAELITSPVQNLLVADRHGIGQFTTGRVPVRRAGDGSVPVAGADGGHDWTGFASGEVLPHEIAPPGGRLVNANERTAPPDFPVFMGRDWFGDFRARRIREMLAATNRHDPASFAAMQVDPRSSFAAQVLPRLLATVPADGASARALAMLADWHGDMLPGLPQPLLFNEWVRQFDTSLLQRAGVPPGVAGLPSDLVAYALTPAGAWWCGGECGPQLAASLKAAVADLAAQHGPAPEGWRWGAVHQAVFAHPLLGQIPVLRALATWRIEQPGDDTTVYRGGTRADGWASIHGAGYRGVYDLADLDRSLFAITPGQSGHPLRRTAASLMRSWRDGTSLHLGPQQHHVNITLHLLPQPSR